MVKNVITSNGNFMITDSLYESIKHNNPELLEYKIKSKAKDDIINRVENIIGARIDRKKAEELLNDDNVKNMSNKEKMQYIINNASSQPEMSNIVNNISINASNKISHDVKNVQKQSQKRIKNQKNNITSDTNNDDNDNKLSLEKFINNDSLKQEIIRSEELAITLVKYIKTIERKRLGTFGSDIQTTKSYSKDSYAKNNNSAATPNEKNNDLNNDLNNNLNKNDLNDTNIRNRYKKSGVLDNIKAYSKLMLGGFILKPIDTNSYDIGLSLRFLGDAIENNDTKIAQMIKITYDIRNNNVGNIKDIDKNRDKFEQMVNNYLKNICYKMTINSTEDFNSMIQVMKYDPKIRARFNIREMNDIRFMDAKRTIVLFVNKIDNNPSLLVIVEPVLARTKEMLKSFSPLINKLKNLQG